MNVIDMRKQESPTCLPLRDSKKGRFGNIQKLASSPYLLLQCWSKSISDCGLLHVINFILCNLMYIRIIFPIFFIQMIVIKKYNKYFLFKFFTTLLIGSTPFECHFYSFQIYPTILSRVASLFILYLKWQDKNHRVGSERVLFLSYQRMLLFNLLFLVSHFFLTISACFAKKICF